MNISCLIENREDEETLRGLGWIRKTTSMETHRIANYDTNKHPHYFWLIDSLWTDPQHQELLGEIVSIDEFVQLVKMSQL